MNGRAQVYQGLQKKRYDVALFNTQVPAVLAGKMARSRPYVICTDFTPVQYDRMAVDYQHTVSRSRAINTYKHLANVKTLREASFLLPWSKWAGDSLIADYRVDARRVVVIPPGVNLEVWRPGTGENSGRPRILFVGTDLYRKGGAMLIEAYKSLPAGSAELVLVTKSAVPEMEGVHVYRDLKPNSPELISLYQSCHLFVLPSKGEAFGIAAVEASAVGLPVIASSVGGLSEVVVENETGFLIQPGNVLNLTSNLRLLVENASYRRQMGQAARVKAEKSFNAKENALRVVSKLKDSVL